MFKNSFPDEKESLTMSNVTKAIASFERTLISYNSAYDRYIYQKDDNAISESAKRGEKLFYSEKILFTFFVIYLRVFFCFISNNNIISIV